MDPLVRCVVAFHALALGDVFCLSAGCLRNCAPSLCDSPLAESLFMRAGSPTLTSEQPLGSSSRKSTAACAGDICLELSVAATAP